MISNRMHDYGTSHHRADGFYFCYSAGLEGVHRRIPKNIIVTYEGGAK